MPKRVRGRYRRDGRETLNGSLWEENGHLGPGVHDLTLTEFRPFVATTPYRREMWNRLMAFLSWPVMEGRFSYVYLGGGFASATPRPHDIDLILQTREPYGPEAFQAIERYFRVGLVAINEIFGIHLHFWMENAPAGFADYRVFFQYAKPAQPRDLTRQGLVRISLLHPDVRKEFRHLLGGFELSDDLPPQNGPDGGGSPS